MAKKHWDYIDNAKVRKHGTMVCTKCNKFIKSGEYRVRETEEAYLSQHRKCSLDDPEWAMRDKRRVREYKQLKERLSEYIAFRDKWDEDCLDDEIGDMKQSINSFHDYLTTQI